MAKKLHRAAKFIPGVILHLEKATSFNCRYSELPKSYQAQPHNVAAKILERGNIHVTTIFNKANDNFVLLKKSAPIN